MFKSSLYKCFSIIIVITFIISPISTISSQNTNILTQTLTSQEKDALTKHFLSDANQIANVLIKSAVKDNVSGLKWNKYYNLTDTLHHKYFFGYYYGAAGIGNYFTNLYNQTLNATYLNIAIQSYNYINAHAIENGSYYDSFFSKPGFVFWLRSETDPYVYIGIKYGNPGFSNFLFNLYLNTMNRTYLNLGLKSLETLIYTARKGSEIAPWNTGIYWPYSLSTSDTITDVIYGDAGITSSFLNAYKITKNETYLNIATQAISFIISESGITNNSTNGQRFIRFSPSPFYPFTFTGYLTGASGIGSVILEYYQITKNPDYLLFAEQIGNWLAANGTNGLWNVGGADLLTNSINSAGSFTGFGAGSAGIGMFLLDLYNATSKNTYLKVIKQITNMYTKEAIIAGDTISFYTKIGDPTQKVIQTDLKMGLAGIGLYFSTLYHYFGLNESLNFLNGLVNYLDSEKDSNGIIPKTIGLGNSDNTNYDLSLLEGIAGIGYFYLIAFHYLNSTIIFKSSVYMTLNINSGSVPGFETVPFFIVIIFLWVKKKRNEI